MKELKIKISDLKHLKEISSYNNNYYILEDKLIRAEFDDDNTTELYVINIDTSLDRREKIKLKDDFKISDLKYLKEISSDDNNYYILDKKIIHAINNNTEFYVVDIKCPIQRHIGYAYSDEEDLIQFWDEEPKKEEYEDEFEREVVKWLEKKVKEIEEIEKENKNANIH